MGLAGPAMGLMRGVTGEVLPREAIPSQLMAGLREPLRLPTAPSPATQLLQPLDIPAPAQTPMWQPPPQELTAPFAELPYERQAALLGAKATELGAPLQFGPGGYITGFGPIPTEGQKELEQLVPHLG